MLDRSVSYFLSNYWRNTPLYAEKIIPLLDTCLSNNYTLSDKMSGAYYELINKYQNTADLPVSALKEFINELGYGYILDLVVQDDKSVKALWYLLPLIHQLKGTKDGVLLVLSLFDKNFDPSKTKINQWFETLPVGKENTFSLESTVDISKLGDSFFKKFQNFISHYVYPEMLALKVNHSVDGRITYRPYVRLKIKYNTGFKVLDYITGGTAQDVERELYYCGIASSDTVDPVFDKNINCNEGLETI